VRQRRPYWASVWDFLLDLKPLTLVLNPFFAVGFALLVNLLVERSRLPTDALLNIVYFPLPCPFAVVALSW